MKLFGGLFGGKKQPNTTAAPALGKKESAIGSLISVYQLGQAVWTPRDYERFSTEAYGQNVIAYACIKKIAASASTVPWCLYLEGGEREIDKHPLLDLLRRPNPLLGKAEFWESVIAYGLIAGNSYLEAAGSNVSATFVKNPRELWAWRPDRVKIIAGKSGLPQAYRYSANGLDRDIPVDIISGRSRILHLRHFHPNDDWYGLSPIEAAAYSIDQHNAQAEWNQSLLQNGGRPSHAFVFKNATSQVSIDEFRAGIDDRYQGTKNAGKPLIMGGDIEIKEMGFTPVDMDFLNVKLTAARDICRAFGVPPALIVEGEGTFSNRIQAREELWLDTIIPLFDSLTDSLNGWLAPMFEDGLLIKPDYDAVAALSGYREAKRQTVRSDYQSGLITLNEARLELGYEKLPEGDQPRGGFGGGFGLDTLMAKPGKLEVKRNEATGIENEITRPELVDEITRLTEKLLADVVLALGAERARKLGQRIAFENSFRVQNYIKARGAQLVTQTTETTRRVLRKQIAEGMEAGEGKAAISARIQAVFAEASKGRAEVIAQTESTAAAGFSAKESIQQAGISQKEWVATQDEATRESHAEMDGQTVSTEGTFYSPNGDQAEYPGGFGSAEENINCRCTVIASFGKSGNPEGLDRKAIWQDYEEKRRRQVPTFKQAFRDIFRMQEAAILKRLDAVMGE